MPLRHLGVNRFALIDIGECGLFVTTCNRHYGHAYVGARATEVRAHVPPPPCPLHPLSLARAPHPESVSRAAARPVLSPSRRVVVASTVATPTATQVQRYIKGIKFTLVMGVSACGEVFAMIIKDGNLDGQGFDDFLATPVFPLIGDRARVLMWDNLKAHLSATIQAIVANTFHQTLARPPYSPEFGPIEFVFGVIEGHLRKWQFQNVDDENFPNVINAAIRMATDARKFDNIFMHCGY